MVSQLRVLTEQQEQSETQWRAELRKAWPPPPCACTGSPVAEDRVL